MRETNTPCLVELVFECARTRNRVSRSNSTRFGFSLFGLTSAVRTNVLYLVMPGLLGELAMEEPFRRSFHRMSRWFHQSQKRTLLPGVNGWDIRTWNKVGVSSRD